jgi:hypothetical protein
LQIPLCAFGREKVTCLIRPFVEYFEFAHHFSFLERLLQTHL